MSKQQKEQKKEEREKSVVTKGPGYLLQAARIEQGVSIDDIARQMNLNARILNSLEEDDYSDIQSPIFIRGYLRTYARLVNVDEDSTIKIFSEFYQKDDPDIKAIGNTAPQISSNDIRVKWMTYAVIIGLIALLSIWWVNNYKDIDLPSTSLMDGTESKIDSENITINETEITTVEIVDVSIGSEPMQEGVVNAADVKSRLPIVEDIITDKIVKESTLAGITIPQQNNKNFIQKPTTETLNDEASVIDVSKLNVSDSVASTADNVFTIELNAPTGNDILEIKVIATSWGEIRDGSKFNLIQDLMNSGTSYRLQGEKPFNIFLGNGYGVELVLNGKAVDFSKHIKSSNNTARFELEQ